MQHLGLLHGSVLVNRQWGKIIPEEDLVAGKPYTKNAYNITYTGSHGTPTILSYLNLNWGSLTEDIRNASIRYGSIYRDTFVYYVTENLSLSTSPYIFWLAIG